jgi:hypothetical protein
MGDFIHNSYGTMHYEDAIGLALLGPSHKKVQSHIQSRQGMQVMSGATLMAGSMWESYVM